MRQWADTLSRKFKLLQEKRSSAVVRENATLKEMLQQLQQQSKTLRHAKEINSVLALLNVPYE